MRENIDPSAPYGIESAINASERPLRSFGERLLAALKLENELYEEVEHDPRALPQAFAIVLLSSFAASVGYSGLFGFGSIAAGITAGLFSWIAWTAIVWAVGVRLFEGTSDPEELFRTLGFVAAPQLLFLLLIVPIPIFRSLLGFVVLIMTVVAFLRATRAALDVGTGRGLVIASLCLFAHLILSAAFAALVTVA